MTTPFQFTPTSLFTPTQISGCALWLDAADTATVSLTGTNVTQWNDKSSNATPAVAGTTVYPIYASNQLNRFPIVTLRGASDYFVVANNFTTTTYPSLCYCIVMRGASTQTAQFAGLLSTMGQSWGRSLGFGSSTGTVGDALQEGYYGSLANIVSYVQNTWVIVSLQFVTTVSATMTQNGVSTAAVASPTGTNTNGFTIGSYSSAGSPAYSTYNSQVDIAELLVYGGVLTTAQRQQIEGYFAWKWGLQANLPANHPYKTSILYSQFINPYRLLPVVRRFTNAPSFFSPTSVPGCALWLDASDRTTLALTGTNVTQWNDKSVNATPAVAGTSVYPVYGTTTLNSVPVVAMRGASDYFVVANNFTTTTYPSICYFIVMRGASTQTAQFAGVLSTMGQSWGRSLGLGSTTGTVGDRLQEGYYGSLVNLVTYVQNTWVIVSLQFVTTVSATITQNGVSTAGAASPTGTNTNGFTIGSYSSAGSPAYSTYNSQIDVAEVLVYGGVVTTVQRQQLEGYLAWKWGLQANLPTTHPYRSTPIYAAPPFPLVPQVKRMTTARFSPLRITGCSVWLDASDSTTFTLSGSLVSAWRDKSGNNNNTTNSGFSTPSLQNQTVTFTGTNGLRFSSAFPSFYDIFVIAAPLASTASWRTLLQMDGGTATHTILVETGSTRLGNWFGSFRQFGSLTFTAVRALLFARLNPNLTMEASFNGTPTLTSPTAAVGVASSGSINFGNANGSTQAWGDVNEFLVYNQQLPLSQRQQVEGYLAWKWGLQGSLPVAHPWKRYPPPPS